MIALVNILASHQQLCSASLSLLTPGSWRGLLGVALLGIRKRGWTEGYLEIMIAISTGENFNKRNQVNIFPSLTRTLTQQSDPSNSLHNVFVQGSVTDEGKLLDILVITLQEVFRRYLIIWPVQVCDSSIWSVNFICYCTDETCLNVLPSHLWKVETVREKGNFTGSARCTPPDRIIYAMIGASLLTLGSIKDT